MVVTRRIRVNLDLSSVTMTMRKEEHIDKKGEEFEQLFLAGLRI